MADPAKLSRAGLAPTLKLATFLGFAGGFLLAYQTSSRQCLPFPRVRVPARPSLMRLL